MQKQLALNWLKNNSGKVIFASFFVYSFILHFDEVVKGFNAGWNH
jgi:hypothetical protein